MKIYLTTVEGGHEGPLLCADSWTQAEEAASRLGLVIVVELYDMLPFIAERAPVTLH